MTGFNHHHPGRPHAPHPGGLRRTRIKICGITSVDMALAAVDAGADAIGVVFVPQSPRYLLPGPAQRIARSLPPLISSIGVFANPSDPDLANWRGQWVQMHGQEEEPQLARVANLRRIIKGLKFDRTQVMRWDKCPHVSALLVDGLGGTGGGGGMGEAFNHEQLAQMRSNIATPLILAGGLTPETVGNAIRMIKPYGVDVSSGVESSRGVKDASLIREFCAAVREADASMGMEDHRVAAPVPPGDGLL